MLAQGQAHRGADRVHPFTCGLQHHIRSVVDDIGVVAKAAGQDVGAGAAIEQVIAVKSADRIDTGGASDHVADAVATRVKVAGRTGGGDKGQVFHMIRQDQADRTADRVRAAAS